MPTPLHHARGRGRGPSVELHSERRFVGVAQTRLLAATKQLLREGLHLPRAAVSLSLIGDDSMRALNGRWRGKHGPTDVLSFPLCAPPSRSTALPPDVALGDIAICVPQAQRQAHLRRHELEEEILVLLVHGLLHLVGHDHVHGGRQAARMRREETRLLHLLSPPGRLLRCLLGSRGGS